MVLLMMETLHDFIIQKLKEAMVLKVWIGFRSSPLQYFGPNSGLLFYLGTYVNL